MTSLSIDPERRKRALHVVMRFLADEGLCESLETLKLESKFTHDSNMISTNATEPDNTNYNHDHDHDSTIAANDMLPPAASLYRALDALDELTERAIEESKDTKDRPPTKIEIERQIVCCCF
jgi:hypothetical protein